MKKDLTNRLLQRGILLLRAHSCGEVSVLIVVVDVLMRLLR